MRRVLLKIQPKILLGMLRNDSIYMRYVLISRINLILRNAITL